MAASAIAAEESIRQPIEAAATLVTNAGLRDASFPDLNDCLEGSSSRGDTFWSGLPSYELARMVRLPEALFSQFNHVECKCFMGLFPEIQRAWLTIDNQVFLWNFQDGSDFSLYDELDQVITCAALVRPRPGVFVEEIEYVLVLTTPVKVVLLGVSFTPRTNAPVSSTGDPSHGYAELRFHPTDLSIASDNVSMLSIAGTPNGRILMGGSDGCVYEIVYQSSEGWFQRRISKINHSTGLISSLIPPLFKFSSSDAIKELAYDHTRGTLYTLSDCGVISVYDLGYDGVGMTRIATHDSIYSQAARASSLDKRQLAMISLHPVPVTESAYISLVAVTVSGIRLFFSTVRADERRHAFTASSIRSNPRSHRPACLDLVHVRHSTVVSETAPSSHPNNSTNAPSMYLQQQQQQQQQQHASGFSTLNPSSIGATTASQLGRVHTALYTRGCLVTADARLDEEDILTCVFPDNTSMTTQNRVRVLTEGANLLKISGRTYAIAEATSHLASRLLHHTPAALRNELLAEHLESPRVFLVLTNAGIHVLVKNRPVDELVSLLSAGSAGEDRLARFFDSDRYGQEQACAMCLLVACGLLPENPYTTLPNVSQFQQEHSVTGTTDPAVAQAASRAFFERGGNPSFPGAEADAAAAATASRFTGGASSWHQQGQMGQGGPAAISSPSSAAYVHGRAVSQELQYSGAHDGLCLFASRILASVWSQPIAVVSSDSSSSSSSSTSLHSSSSSPSSSTNAASANGSSSYSSASTTAPSPRIRSRIAQLTELQHVHTALLRLRDFINMNQHYFAHGPMHGVDLAPRLHVNPRYVEQQRLRWKKTDEALRMERRSLAAIAALLERCAETMSVWRMLFRAPFARVATRMSDSLISSLCKLSFRDLCVSSQGRSVTRQLISALMQACTADGVGVDAISAELREQCPGLFSIEDTTLYRAHELLMIGISARPASQGISYLRQATKLFCTVSQRCDLGRVCGQMLRARHYDGIVDLVLTYAREVDPQEFAYALMENRSLEGSSSSSNGGGAGVGGSTGHHGDLTGASRSFGSGSAPVSASHQSVRDAFVRRMEAYVCLTTAFDDVFQLTGFRQLYQQSKLMDGATLDELAQRDTLEEDARTHLQTAMLQRALANNDMLWHNTLYRWFCERGMAQKLLDLSTPYIETFLSTHAGIEENLKWQYHVRHENFHKAAILLMQMAERKTDGLPLSSRIESLSRAISNAKSCAPRALGGASGELLHDLEQKMEVAKLQRMVFEELSRKESNSTHGSDEQVAMATALRELSFELTGVTPMYQIAQRFALAESALAILHCSGHNDKALVLQYWRDLFAQVRAHTSTSPEAVAQGLGGKLTDLGRQFYPSKTIFPVDDLCVELEHRNLELFQHLEAARADWVVRAMRAVGVPMRDIFNVYHDTLYHSRERVWQQEGPRLHVLNVLVHIMTQWLADTRAVNTPVYERNECRTLVDTAGSQYVTDLQSREGDRVRSLMAQLKTLLESVR